MGGGEDAHVDRRLALLADRPHGFFLDHAQQLHLHVQRQVGHFVEEQRAAFGRLDQADLVGHGAREAAALVAEQLALHELGREWRRSSPARTGPSARGPEPWIMRATSSLPVPDSPEMCTGAWLRATRRIISRSRSMAGALPMSCVPVRVDAAGVRRTARA